METKFYQSDRTFNIYDFQLSHAQLLLRSPKKTMSPENIDIIFYNAVFMQMGVDLNGVLIELGNFENSPFSKNVKAQKFNDFNAHHTFKINTEGETYWILASFFQIFTNNLEFIESSLDMEEGRLTRIGPDIDWSRVNKTGRFD